MNPPISIFKNGGSRRGFSLEIVDSIMKNTGLSHTWERPVKAHNLLPKYSPCGA